MPSAPASQVSTDHRINSVLAELFCSEGNEIYIRSALEYCFDFERCCFFEAWRPPRSPPSAADTAATAAAAPTRSFCALLGGHGGGGAYALVVCALRRPRRRRRLCARFLRA